MSQIFNKIIHTTPIFVYDFVNFYIKRKHIAYNYVPIALWQ